MTSKLYNQGMGCILFLLIVTAVHSQPYLSVTLLNPNNFSREDELITMSRKTLESKLKLPIQFIQVTKAQSQIPLQYVDENGDGQWDECIFLYSFAPNKKAILKVAASTQNKITVINQKAHVRMRKKTGHETFGPNLTSVTMPVRNPATDFSKERLPMYLTEGPAWENDKVAFRLYFDVRNNKDIYGKTTPRMMMDTVGANTKMSYHLLSEWGMDVLHVVKSLGAGALAVSVPRAGGGDTLIRLGGQNITNTVFQQVADGPLLGRLTLTYDWQINNNQLQVKEEISIWGGQYFYDSKVTIIGAPAGAKLVTGIADFYENTFDIIKAGKAVVGFSYGKQSENKDNLGMAVLVDKQNFVKADSVNRPNTDVNETYTMTQTISNNHPMYYRFYVGWEPTDKWFVSSEGFSNYLKEEAVKYSEPVKVKYTLVSK
ncbi:MAG: DUF4861 domain-containing protein [Chitinophagaceae bacterium]|nr:DUF4861 domain-containing protein [Chitinophagaceae bacterium]